MNTKLFTFSRTLLGLIFLIFGSNGLLMILTGSGFIPFPPPPPELMEVMGGLMKIGYLMPLVKGLEIISALLLLSNRYINLAIIFLGPVIVNIFCVHLFIDQSGLLLAIIIVILFSVVIKCRWSDLKVLLKR